MGKFSIGTASNRFRKEECSPQTKRQPVMRSLEGVVQDIVATPRETYKGFLALANLRRKLGELEPPRLKTVDNVVETQVRVKC
jgi:hypothetical protein